MKTPHKRWLVPATVVLLAVMGLTVWWLLLRQPPLPAGMIQANGRIEGDHYLVAGKTPGRVVELFAREGAAVQKDQVLLRLDAAQVDARVEQAARDAARFKRLAESGTVDRHRYEQMELASPVAQNRADAAQHGVISAEKQLAQAKLGLERIRAREDEVAYRSPRPNRSAAS